MPSYPQIRVALIAEAAPVAYIWGDGSITRREAAINEKRRQSTVSALATIYRRCADRSGDDSRCCRSDKHDCGHSLHTADPWCPGWYRADDRAQRHGPTAR